MARFQPPLFTRTWFLLALLAPAGAFVSPWLGLGILAALVAVGLYDGRRAATTDRVDVALALEPRASLGGTVEARLQLRARGDAPVEGSAALELDGALVSSHGTRIAPFVADPSSELTFELGALRRGYHGVHAVHVVVRGPLGLAVGRARRPLEAQTLIAAGLAAALRLELRHRLGQRLEVGRHTTRQRGDAGTFDSLREYQRGDDPRRIDWKASGRRGHPVVRLMTAERRQDIVLVLDLGRSQREFHGGKERLDDSLEAALCLGAAAAAYGDRVGLLAFSGTVVRWLPPAVRSLGSLAKEMAVLNATAEEPDYKGALLELAQRLPRRALVVLFSDAVDEEVSEPLIAGLSMLSRRHLALFAALQSPALLDATERPITAPRDMYLLAAILELNRARATALEGLRRCGIQVLDVPSARAAPAAVAAYLDIKGRGRL